MARAFARKEAARLLALREQGPDACPVCKPAKGRLKRAIAAGLREALFPACDPCRRPPETEQAEPAEPPPPAAAHPRRPIHTRGSVTERVAGVVIAKKQQEEGPSQHADPTRSSFTLWELRKDGPRNECDYRVFLDERYRSQPYVMEKVPCVHKDSELSILGRSYAVHIPDAPRYSPVVA